MIQRYSLLLIAALQWVCILGGGLDGTDFVYYSVNATTGSKSLSDGVTLKTWDDLEHPFGTVVSRLEFNASASLPAAGETGIWPSDCYVVVVEGNVTMGKTVDGNAVFGPGDMIWIAGGTMVGPLAATADADAALSLMCDGNAAFELEGTSEAPTGTSDSIGLLNTSILAFHANATTHTLPDGYRFAYPGEFALADSVHWAADSGFPPHYHPRGSFYTVITGSLTYGGDRDEYVRIGNGDTRWVRPGWYYTAEFTTEDTVFLALHTSVANLDSVDIVDKSFVSWDEPPTTPFKIQFKTTQTRWFDEQVLSDKEL